MELAEKVWSAQGEGLILKEVSAPYIVGKRSKTWLKIKELRSAVLQITGYNEGTMGKHSIIVLEDEEGNETTVKWKNFKELAKIEADPQAYIGRKVRIDFQCRTPDGSYRHPRWDRWENE